MTKRNENSEPTMKQLKEIMHEVAVDAKRKAEQTSIQLKEQIKKEIALAFQRLKDSKQWS